MVVKAAGAAKLALGNTHNLNVVDAGVIATVPLAFIAEIAKVAEVVLAVETCALYTMPSVGNTGAISTKSPLAAGIPPNVVVVLAVEVLVDGQIIEAVVVDTRPDRGARTAVMSVNRLFKVVYNRTLFREL